LTPHGSASSPASEAGNDRRAVIQSGQTHAVPGSPGPAQGRLVVALLALAGLTAAWLVRFVQDDAFICFNFARSLAQGNGLTWFGERIEAYTNFLWVLWIAAGLRLGRDPVTWSYLGSMAAFLGAVYSTWQLARLVLQHTRPALLAVLLLLVNYTFLAYATGGLETMLQCFLLTQALVQVWTAAARPVSTARLFSLSLLLAAAVLTRPDSALPGGMMVAAAIVFLARRRESWRSYAALLSPGAIIIGAWLGWKLAYYGDLLPNSFYAKVGLNAALVANGLRYVGRFFHWYMVWPFLLLGSLVLLIRRRRVVRHLVLPATIVAAWCLYVVLVGGDFMEFRFLVPVWPLLAVILAYCSYAQLGQAFLRRPIVASLISVAVLASASVVHAVRFRWMTHDKSLDSIPALATFYGVYPDRNWRIIGDSLKAAFAGREVLLALAPVGAIPYYSGMKPLDMLGLTDRFVAEYGIASLPEYPRPGHQRHAPLAYMLEQGTNFVVGHPTVIDPGILALPDAGFRLGEWVTQKIYPDTARVSGMVATVMPLAPGWGLLMWYLTQRRDIDSVIRTRGWTTREFVFTQSADAP